MRAAAERHGAEIRKLYSENSSAVAEQNYLRKKAAEIKQRQVKNACLSILSTLDTPEAHSMIRKQFDSATNASDKLVGLSLYLNSSAPDKMKVLEEYSKAASQNLVRWEAFLSVVGHNDAEDAIKIIRQVEKSPYFRIEQSNDQRALYATFASNKKKSLLTPEGRDTPCLRPGRQAGRRAQGSCHGSPGLAPGIGHRAGRAERLQHCQAHDKEPAWVQEGLRGKIQEEGRLGINFIKGPAFFPRDSAPVAKRLRQEAAKSHWGDEA